MNLINYVNGKNFIGGEWISSSNQINVTNPSSDIKIGNVPELNREKIEKAIDTTSRSFKAFSKVSMAARVEILRKWHDLIMQNAQGLAHIISLEQGKVAADAISEVKYGASFIEWYADLLPHLEGSIKPGRTSNHKIITEYEPIGPCAAITPWNFPLAMITRKLAPAIAAGCTMLVKPSELTPFSALALAKLAGDAGLSNGEVNVITGKSALIGAVICSSDKIRKLSFTGSTEVGKLLYEKSAGTLKKLSLELGGNAPFIIYNDVDILRTAEDLIAAKIRSNGQSCISPNRIFIHDDIYEQFTDILKDKFLSLKAGDALDNKSDIGPLINNNAIKKIQNLISDAKNKGAIIFGGNTNDNFLSPTLALNLNKDMEIFRNEIFGPVLACYKFSSTEEVIDLANDTEYGLQAYIYTKDLNEAKKVVENLDFGMVSINSSSPSNSAAPFGGRKHSGFGSEGGSQGILEYFNIKYMNLNFI